MFLDMLLIGVVAICMLTDLYNRKIYNVVLFPALLLTLGFKLIDHGVYGALGAVAGLLAGIAILFVPYWMGGMGAGDVKLLGLIGAVKGTAFLLPAAVYMALFGGAMAILTLLCRKQAWLLMRDVLMFLGCLKAGYRYPIAIRRDALAGTMPYGVAIGAGAIFSLGMNGGWIA